MTSLQLSHGRQRCSCSLPWLPPIVYGAVCGLFPEPGTGFLDAWIPYSLACDNELYSKQGERKGQRASHTLLRGSRGASFLPSVAHSPVSPLVIATHKPSCSSSLLLHILPFFNLNLSFNKHHQLVFSTDPSLFPYRLHRATSCQVAWYAGVPKLLF